jgi:hypothetical protein
MLKVLEVTGLSRQTANRGAALDQKIDQMAADETARAGHQSL